MTATLRVETTAGPARAVELPTASHEAHLYRLELAGVEVLVEIPDRLAGDVRDELARRRELLAGVAERAFG